MCCLKNEEETYEYLNSKLPAVGDTVTTASGLQGEVSSVNVLRQRVKVLVDVDDEKELQEYDVNELKFKPRKKKEKGTAETRRAKRARRAERKIKTAPKTARKRRITTGKKTGQRSKERNRRSRRKNWNWSFWKRWSWRKACPAWRITDGRTASPRGAGG